MNKKCQTIFIIVFSLITGCASTGVKDVLRGIELNPGAGYFIEGVPFFPQEEYMCGPSAMASVFNYHGRTVSAEEISRKVFEPGLKGALAMDMLIYAKEEGFEARYYSGGLEDLKAQLKKKRPAILFLNLGLTVYPVGHFIVAVGYNDDLGVVVAHSGRKKDSVMSYGELLKAWEKTDFSTLIISPKRSI